MSHPALSHLASAYLTSAERIDRDGFELEGADLYAAVVLAIAASRSQARATVRRLGPVESCPGYYRGELLAAEREIRCCDAAMASLMPRKVITTSAVELLDVG